MLTTVVKVDYEKHLIGLYAKDEFAYKVNDELEIKRARKVRTPPQNSLLWVFYDYCILSGLKEDHGLYNSSVVHEVIKAWLKAEYPLMCKKAFSTTELSKSEFSEIFDLINQRMIEFYSLDTSGFWVEYNNYIEWQKYNTGNFRDYRLTKV